MLTGLPSAFFTPDQGVIASSLMPHKAALCLCKVSGAQYSSEECVGAHNSKKKLVKDSALESHLFFSFSCGRLVDDSGAVKNNKCQILDNTFTCHDAGYSGCIVVLKLYWPQHGKAPHVLFRHSHCPTACSCIQPLTQMLAALQQLMVKPASRLHTCSVLCLLQKQHKAAIKLAAHPMKPVVGIVALTSCMMRRMVCIVGR